MEGSIFSGMRPTGSLHIGHLSSDGEEKARLVTAQTLKEVRDALGLV
ncbi:MAG: hypothetical protein QMC95_10345 [Desulfitobacteriaceae bacterium]|nr:hypothetical protein [Desulfitobacteriaceae bacterium]MDI6878838.1 hypothetical protein [Desulfitobacteriaceae bacterium]MDI6914609.1 hypothetical protein [Desulfitobacteriaceae bacterium]